MYKHGCPRRFLSQNHHSSRLTETNMDTKNLRRSVVTHGSSAFLSSDSSDSFSSCSQERIIPKGLGTRHRRSQITCVCVCVCVCVWQYDSRNLNKQANRSRDRRSKFQLLRASLEHGTNNDRGKRSRNRASRIFDLRQTRCSGLLDLWIFVPGCRTIEILTIYDQPTGQESFYARAVIYFLVFVFTWCIRVCSRRDDQPRRAAKPVSRAPRRLASWCSAYAGKARTSTFSGSSAAIPRRWRFFEAVFWAAAAAVEAGPPSTAAVEAWAGRWRATRLGSPPGNLHLGMRIAVYLVALGIANRVCRSVVLEIQWFAR